MHLKKERLEMIDAFRNCGQQRDTTSLIVNSCLSTNISDSLTSNIFRKMS
jgi:hypothetical protein